MLRDSGLGAMSRHPTIATSSRMEAPATTADTDDEQSPSNEDLFGQLPGGKRRTFILVEDPQRGSRVRVKVGLDKINMDDLPDSYRKLNAVYPRTYFPVQMKDAPGASIPSNRYFRDDTDVADDDALTVGRTTVPAPSLDGERDIVVPKLSRRGHRKEVMLNDLGYRLSWSQSRVFAGRMLFLQQSCKLTSSFLFPLLHVSLKPTPIPFPFLPFLFFLFFPPLHSVSFCSPFDTAHSSCSRAVLLAWHGTAHVRCKRLRRVSPEAEVCRVQTIIASTNFDRNIVDAYRNKMRSSMLAAGQDPAEIPEHFDTRRGKRRFLERAGRMGSAVQRSAEEVEG